jgi:fructosamine-3-kinase
MSEGLIYLLIGAGVIIWLVFFAKHLIAWLFDLKKRRELMEEQNELLREILEKLK